MQKRVVITATIIVILFLVAEVIFSFSQSSSLNSLEPSNNAVYAYEFIVPGYNYSGPNNYTFQVALGNYHNIIKQYNKVGSFFVNSTSECIINSKGLYLIIRILGYKENLANVNATMMFVKGDALCGKNYGQLPKTDENWSYYNGYYKSVFQTMNFSRKIIIDTANSNAQSPNGYPYGDWPFWMDKNELSNYYTLILFGLSDGAGTPFNITGIANVIPVNMSQSSPYSYKIGKLIIPANEQVFINKSQLPLKEVISNVSENAANKIIQNIEACYKTSCRSSLLSTAFLSNNPIQYQNNSVIIENSKILNTMNLSYKAWKLYYIRFQSFINLYGNYNETSYFPVIYYNDTRYVTTGFSSLNLSASYSRNGILLYISGDTNGNLFDMLPAAIVRAFGISPPAGALYAGTQISLELVSFHRT